ncbi:substrate-binding domain-containing protein [Anaerolineales bacterium]
MSDMNRRDFLKSAGVLGMGALGANVLGNVSRVAAQDGTPLRCAMSSTGLAGTWNLQGKTAAEYWGKLLGVEVVWFDGEHNVQAQRNKVDQIAAEQWDFVAIQPASIGILAEPVAQIIANGIPVIDMDSLIAPLDEMWDMGVLTLIASDNVSLAEAVVSKIVEKMGYAGKIARTGGVASHTGAQNRQQGFWNVVNRYPDIEVVDDQAADWSGELAGQLWQSIIDAHPDIKGGFFDNDDMALAARGVIQAAGLLDQVAIGGVDAMPPAIEAVGRGEMLATARNSPTRIHGWAMIVGVHAATVGMEQARTDIPKFILADGPLITSDVDDNPDLSETPWKLRNYGLSSTEGQVWLEEQSLL